MEKEGKPRDARIRLDSRKLVWVVDALKLELLTNKGKKDPDRHGKMNLLNRLVRYAKHGLIGRVSDMFVPCKYGYNPKSSKDREELASWIKEL